MGIGVVMDTRKDSNERWGCSSNCTGKGCSEGKVAHNEGEGAHGVKGILAGMVNSVCTSN